MNTALLFSGQGSQYVGMTKDLYQQFPKAASTIDKADEVLGYSLRSIMFDGPVDLLKETRYTQPALFVHEAVVIELIRDSIEFQAVAGHSLGEYSALYSVGVLAFEDALRLVARRGELMYEAGTTNPGTMYAIVGLDDETVIQLCQELSNENEIIVAANFNSPGQIVVSGNSGLLHNSTAAFKEAGAKLVKELPVSGAFHSPLLKPAQDSLRIAIENCVFNDASADVYSNVSALPVRMADEIKPLLIQQLTSPVLWTQTLKNLQQNGIDSFIEIGPGKVLQGLVKRTLENVSENFGIDTANDVIALERI